MYHLCNYMTGSFKGKSLFADKALSKRLIDTNAQVFAKLFKMGQKDYFGLLQLLKVEFTDYELHPWF